MVKIIVNYFSVIVINNYNYGNFFLSVNINLTELKTMHHFIQTVIMKLLLFLKFDF